MAIFYNRRPRSYNHIPIYSDDRKDRLREMEERAKRELGIASAEMGNEKLRGAFVDNMKHLRRYREKSSERQYIVVVLLIMMLLLFMYFLLSGDLCI